MTTSPPSPTDLFERIRFRGQPLANPDSIVRHGRARFSVLTPRLLRLEWSETGEFEDRASYAFPTRHAPAPPFSSLADETGLSLDTGALQLRYRGGDGPFDARNLAISFELDGQPRTWRPGTPNPRNLRGTRRTLDRCAGDAVLEEGPLSREGWAVFDDSRSVVFDADGWVAPRPDRALQDWYFFGYGHDYQAALADYTRFGGPIPLIPRFVLGAWWSRYWAYSDQDLKDLVLDFERHDLPLDVLVVDIDWHTPHSWTGYTWNRELFPDPPGFLRWVRERGLRSTLNLHPAQGVGSFEEVYPRFARAMGVDPATGAPVPLRITDKRFVRHYFELLHHPLEDEGVDFWWMDWQQGETSEMKGLDPLPWLNHLHHSDAARRGGRPMLYSRWGGLGNHRYPIGFSGDTYATWEALQFQPYFTATASNVWYGWWSHDIGGHMGGATQPELYARWVQFGALSPCLRLHATKDPLAERRPWKYPEPVYRAAQAAFRLRYQLIPYLYTMARLASDTGVSLCRPMYYEYPGAEAAYAARYQYFLGDQVIAAPILHPAHAETGMAAADVWIPEGTWIDYATKECFTGPRWARLVGDLERVPMLVKAGAIMPLASVAQTSDAMPKDRLTLAVFPGAEGSFRLYEDDGVSLAYQAGEYEWTHITSRLEAGNTWVVEVAPVEGRCDALPEGRAYEIRLEGSRRPDRVTLDGEEHADWTYHPEGLTTLVQVPRRPKGRPLTVTATADVPISALGPAHNRAVVHSDVRRLLGEARPADLDDVDAVLGLDAPGRADALARLGGPFVRLVEFTTPQEASQAVGRLILGAPVKTEAACDLDVVVTRRAGGESHRRSIQIKGATDAQVLDLPFAFDGQIRPMRWEAEVTITWRGRTLTYNHQAQPWFPTVYAWRALAYDPERAPISLEQALHGHADPDLGWTPCRQELASLANLVEPHVVYLREVYAAELEAGAPLAAAYLAASAVSPDEREVALEFRSAGPADIYLNGQQVAVLPGTLDNPGLSPFLGGARRTLPVWLRPGENSLLVANRPSHPDRRWFFSAALLTPQGQPMTDLIFK